MKKKLMEQETRAKCAYVPPRVEVFASEPGELLAGTRVAGEAGEAEFGEFVGGSGDGGSAGEANLSTGAKSVILGQEFSFSDVWEE